MAELVDRVSGCCAPPYPLCPRPSMCMSSTKDAQVWSSRAPSKPGLDISLFQHAWFNWSANQQALRSLILIVGGGQHLKHAGWGPRREELGTPVWEFCCNLFHQVIVYGEVFSQVHIMIGPFFFPFLIPLFCCFSSKKKKWFAKTNH